MSKRGTIVKESWTGPGRRDGRIEPLTPKDDALHLDPAQKGVYEWWYFDAHLDGGQTVVVFFHAANPNPGMGGKCGIEFVLLSPDGRRKQKFIPYERSQFYASKEKADVRIGRNRLTVEQEPGELPLYEIHVEEEGFSCHLRYQAQVNSWKPGTGLSHFGDMGYFGWVVPFARAAVEGTIRDGERVSDVTGTGYHDHNWLTFQFQKIIDYWMWGRIYSQNFTVSYAFIQCNEQVGNHRVQVLMLAEGREVILSTGEFDFLMADYQYNERAKHRCPRRVLISAPPEFTASLTVREVLEAEDMLSNFNPLLRLIARHILRLKPGYFRLLSDFELQVTRGEETMKEGGATLHEIVLFKPPVPEQDQEPP
jgi:hypothetical protein